MTRRRLVALVSAIVLLMIGIVGVSTVWFLTRTETGRNRVRDIIAPIVAGKVKGGKVYLGRISGSFINGITVDSIEIRDKRGEIFVATGPVSAEWNWRDIADSRLWFRRVTVQHPFVHIIQHADYTWNFKEIFPPSPGPQKPKPANERNLLDYIVLDSVTAQKGTFLLSMPWDPDSSLHGARRDSAIRAQLSNPQRAVSKVFDGYARTYSWRNGNALLPHIRLADPDSDRKFGQEFKIASLSVDEYEPTFKFRNVRGEAQKLGDSVWFNLPHFDMPKSTGHTVGRGKVWWGSELPVRYDITIRGDSVSLDDVNWVYPDLPHNGGGKLDVAIRNDPKNLKVVDFRLQKMDVRSTGSHLTGDMWFGIGAPVLLVRNVDLRADPVNFGLLDTLAGKPFPEPWRGDLFGTVKARGGPLTHFYIDDARATFQDANVRGAVSRVAGKGELDILYPAFTAFHGFNVDAASLDLRTIEYLFPAFPRLGGFVSGTARLDSSWLDVRFSDANVFHRDGPGEPSHATGSGRVTYGEKYMTYDLTLDAQPLNLSMVGRTLFPSLPALGLVSGPIRVSGQSPDLEVVTSLQGAAGALSFDGHVDLDSIGGYGARGRGQFSGFNLAQLLAQASVPVGNLSGHYDIDIAGASAASLHGTTDVSIERTAIDGVRVYPTRAQLRFGDGRLQITDTLRVHTDAATLVARGGIGLPGGRPDTLHFTIDVDSLGGLRPLISHPDTTIRGAAATRPDSLAGTASFEGTLIGTVDVMDLTGRVKADNIYINADRGEHAQVDVALRDILHQRVGTAAARVDSVTLFGVALDTIGGRATFTDSAHVRFVAGALSRTGPTATVAGAWARNGAVQTYRLDSIGLALQSRWHLAAPATIALDTAGGWRIDGLSLQNTTGALVTIAGNVPEVGPAQARLDAAGIPLSDVRMLAQLKDSLNGIANLSVVATGTKLRPEIHATANVSQIRWAGLPIDSVRASADYAASRLAFQAGLTRGGQPTASASGNLPIDMTLVSMQRRNDSLKWNVQIEPTDLSILEPFVGNKLDLSGRLAGNVMAAGTWAATAYSGNVTLRDGTAVVAPLGNVKFQSINATLTGGRNAAEQDSVNLKLWGRTSSHDSVDVAGWLRIEPRNRDATAFNFRLTADSLHAFNRRTVADLTISTRRGELDPLDSLVLRGTFAAPVLSGPLTIDRGAFYLMDRDLARKVAVQDVPAFVSDTAVSAITLGRSAIANEFLKNLQIVDVPIRLGRDVRLRSTEANVLLSGQLGLRTSTSVAARATTTTSASLPPGFQVEGQLATVGGTYNLNLGIVQREFQVLPEGTVTFDGPPETPVVDVKALYNVPQAKDRPLGVIVNLKGRLPNPSIGFSSTADYSISQSDLLSYLVAGRPGFNFGQAGQGGAEIAALLSPTVSAYTSDRLRQAFGNIFDVFQFQLGTTQADVTKGAFTGANLQNYLNTATLQAEKQITSSLFISGSAQNFCQFRATNSLGAHLEYRFDPKLTLQLSYDPGQPLGTCGQQTFVTIVPQPSQAGFSLLHTWRF
jgi:translocation and assembly module TamB